MAASCPLIRSNINPILYLEAWVPFQGVKWSRCDFLLILYLEASVPFHGVKWSRCDLLPLALNETFVIKVRYSMFYLLFKILCIINFQYVICSFVFFESQLNRASTSDTMRKTALFRIWGSEDLFLLFSLNFEHTLGQMSFWCEGILQVTRTQVFL